MVTVLETLNLFATLLIAARIYQCRDEYATSNARSASVVFIVALTALRGAHFLGQIGVPAELAKGIQGALGSTATFALLAVYMVAPPGAPNADLVHRFRLRAASGPRPVQPPETDSERAEARGQELCKTA